MFPAANRMTDICMFSEPLKWMQKLDESWSWFLDRNKGPPVLKQGHWGTVGRIQLALHPVESSSSFQIFPYDLGPESSGPFSRSVHALSTLNWCFDWDFIMLWDHPTCFRGPLASFSSVSLIIRPPSSPLRYGVLHQECAAYTSPAPTLSWKLSKSSGWDTTPDHPSRYLKSDVFLGGAVLAGSLHAWQVTHVTHEFWELQNVFRAAEI